MIDIDDIREARGRIAPYIHRTPIIRSQSLSLVTGADVFVKVESLQKTGAFKVRGALNKMLAGAHQRVITASMGNHAQAVAFVAKETGVRARIIMPVTASIMKEEASRSYGADVELRGDNLKEAMDYALSQKGYTFIHPFDDDQIIAGQGTIGIEIAEELTGIDAVLAPVGGGSLLAGLAVSFKALSPRTQVIGATTESAPSGLRSFLERRIVAAPTLPTLADGIAVSRIGERPFEIFLNHVDDIIPVKEDKIALAVLLHMERMKLVVEGAGAVPLAALLSNRDRFLGKRVLLVASGGNIDFTVIDRIVRKGLVTNGRIAVFEVALDDVPGSLHELTGIVAGHRANILDVSHSRLAEDLPLGKTLVTFTIEIRSRDSLGDLLSSIREGGFHVEDEGP